MKKLLILLILPVFMAAQADRAVVGEVGWLTDYDTALKKANKHNKNVLVYFTGSDWCAPCKMLKKDLFETNQFKDVSQNYVLLYIDIPMNRDLLTTEQLAHNKQISSKHNKKGSVPLLKVLSPNGVELDSYGGYSMSGEVSYHMQLLEKHQ